MWCLLARSELVFPYTLFYRMGEKATSFELETRKKLIAQCLMKTKVFSKH